MRWTAPLLTLLVLLVPGCRRPVPAPIPPSDEECHAAVEELFGSQCWTVVALRPIAGGTIFTPDNLAAVDTVTRRLEEAQTDQELGIRSIVTAPMMKRTASGADLEIIRDQLPTTVEDAARFRQMMSTYEFAAGDLLCPQHSSTFIHLPCVNFEGVDLDALVAEIAPLVAEHLLVAIDGTPGADRSLYAEAAVDGPSADALLVTVSGTEGGAAKRPGTLVAIKALQDRIEGIPEVAGTYSITDDIMLARRWVNKADPAAAVLPVKQLEVNQLLMLYQMSGQADAFGQRLSDDGATALVRVQLKTLTADARERAVEQIRTHASSGLPEDVTAVVCGG